MTALAPLAIAGPILLACLLVGTSTRLPRRMTDIIATGTILAVVGLDSALFAATRAGRVVTWSGGWVPHRGLSVGIALVVDGAGAGLALLAALLTLAALVFSWRYLDTAEEHFQPLMLLFLAGMTGFCLTGDLFDMFVFFELMGAVAYGLTGLKIEEPSALQGALNFGIINSLGAYLSLFGVGLIYARTGQLGLPQLSVALSGHRPDALVAVGFVLVVTGFLVKGAAVPFHFWLADAHAVAPAPVCVLFSGVMVELGLYGALRVYWSAFSATLPLPDLRTTLLAFGLLTAVVGTVMCLQQSNLKRLLAFSTIAHVGLFLSGLGILDPAGTAGIALYILGHAGIKGALFLLAGILLNRYGSVDELRLWNRARSARLTGWLFGISALALAGLPPFGIALGKSLSEDAVTRAGFPYGTALFVLVSALTGGAAIRAGARIFLGLGTRPAAAGEGLDRGPDDEERDVNRPLSRVPFTMLAAVIGLLGLGLLSGVVPAVARTVGTIGSRFTDRTGYVGQALHGVAARPLPAVATSWTLSGVLFDLLSVGLALSVAALALWAPVLPARVRSISAALRPPLVGLRGLHSGHVGDYVTWLAIGVVLLAGFVGLPLVR